MKQNQPRKAFSGLNTSARTLLTYLSAVGYVDRTTIARDLDLSESEITAAVTELIAENLVTVVPGLLSTFVQLTQAGKHLTAPQIVPRPLAEGVAQVF